MSFDVTKNRNGLDVSELISRIILSELSATLEGAMVDANDDFKITFAGTGPLSTIDDTKLDDAINNWTPPVVPATDDESYLIDEYTYTVGEERTIDLSGFSGNFSTVIAFDPSVVLITNAQLLSAAGTAGVSVWEPLNRSSNESALNDGNKTNLVYNNSAQNQTAGFIVGFDFGSPTTASQLIKYDYSTTYYDKTWEVIGTDNADGSDATVLATVTQTSANNNPNPNSITFNPATFRYFGTRVVESNNSSWAVQSEQEIYSGSMETVTEQLVMGVDYNFYITTSGDMVVTNLNEARTIKLIISGIQ